MYTENGGFSFLPNIGTYIPKYTELHLSVSKS